MDFAPYLLCSASSPKKLQKHGGGSGDNMSDQWSIIQTCGRVLWNIQHLLTKKMNISSTTIRVIGIKFYFWILVYFSASSNYKQQNLTFPSARHSQDLANTCNWAPLPPPKCQLGEIREIIATSVKLFLLHHQELAEETQWRQQLKPVPIHSTKDSMSSKAHSEFELTVIGSSMFHCCCLW